MPSLQVNVAIVTCGGLCPGLNDVVQGLVRKLEDYGVPDGNIMGIRCAIPLELTVPCPDSGDPSSRGQACGPCMQAALGYTSDADLRRDKWRDNGVKNWTGT